LTQVPVSITTEKTAEDYMDWLISVGDQLSAWESNSQAVEAWLLEVHERVESLMYEFETLVIEHKKAIETTS